MANFDNSAAQGQSVHKANNILSNVQAVYNAAKIVQALMSLYQAGTDTTFNATVNSRFSQSERAELNQMLVQVNSLVSDWETNHMGALQQ